jgi:hypothetical protein
MTTESTPSPPKWRELYRAAMIELDPRKVPQRINDARNAIMDRMEDTRTKPSYPEYQQLDDAFNGLRSLQQESDRSQQPGKKQESDGSNLRKAG